MEFAKHIARDRRCLLAATVTTVGLRNLTGIVSNGKVTLWATTSASSASGDNGADPKRSSRSPTTFVRRSTTSDVATYGTVYRGVAYVK